MPELPEVEAYRHVAATAVGHRIAGVDVRDPRLLRRAPDPPVVHGTVGGATVEAARRTGKALFLDLSGGHTVLLTFGLRGRLHVDGRVARPDGSFHDRTPRPDHVRLALSLDDGRVLELEDQLRMATLELDRDESDLGVDALDLDRGTFVALVSGTRAPVKSRLMDQSRIAGLGNLIVDGILWEAGIHPARRGDDLDDGELAALWDATVQVRDHVLADGGSHRTRMIRTGSRTVDEPCADDGAPMAKVAVGGRTSFFCPEHQPLR